MTGLNFSEKSFKYFVAAKKNKNSKEWFLKNKENYDLCIKQPFEKIKSEISKKLQKELPGIPVKSTALTRPTRPANRAKEGIVKNFSYLTLTEKRSSLFEWNPAIYIQLGSEKDDNFIAIGLYIVSSRQTSLLRNGIATDFETIDKILKRKQLKSTWGNLKGDLFVRYPKGFAIDQPYSMLIMHKQFYLFKKYSKKDVLSKHFAEILIHDIKLAMPFFAWVRKTVGVYRR
ncbi:MAG: DUF2461 family protein [Pseudobdellovibrio sp.]